MTSFICTKNIIIYFFPPLARIFWGLQSKSWTQIPNIFFKCKPLANSEEKDSLVKRLRQPWKPKVNENVIYVYLFNRIIHLNIIMYLYDLRFIGIIIKWIFIYFSICFYRAFSIIGAIVLTLKDNLLCSKSHNSTLSRVL